MLSEFFRGHILKNTKIKCKLKKSKQASFPLQQLVYFHAVLSLSVINSVSDTAIEVMLCTLILNLAERESATRENVCNLQSFSTIFLQQRSISGLRSGPPVAVALYVASCGHDT